MRDKREICGLVVEVCDDAGLGVGVDLSHREGVLSSIAGAPMGMG